MNLPQQRERVTVDGLGNIGVGKYKVTNNIHKSNVKNSTSGGVANSGNSGIIKTRDLSSRNLPNGLRTAQNHNLTDEDRYYLILDALERAKESGVTIKSNSFIRSVLYGY